MTIININEAKTHLSRYAKRVRAGETILLADRNKPFAEIRPLSVSTTPAKKRKLGQLNGKIHFSENFFAADQEIANDFLGEISKK